MPGSQGDELWPVKEAEPRLAAEGPARLAQAAQTDKAEDRQLGARSVATRCPMDGQQREALEKIRTARPRWKLKAKAKAASKPDDDGAKGRPGRKSTARHGRASDKAQRNSPSDSRVIRPKTGFIQVCVRKLDFCYTDGEGRQGQVVRRRRRGAQSCDGEGSC